MYVHLGIPATGVWGIPCMVAEVANAKNNRNISLCWESIRRSRDCNCYSWRILYPTIISHCARLTAVPAGLATGSGTRFRIHIAVQWPNASPARRAGRQLQTPTVFIIVIFVIAIFIINSDIFDWKVFFLVESNKEKNPARLQPIHSACLSALLSQLTPVLLLPLLVSALGPLFRTRLCCRSRRTSATKIPPNWHKNQLKSLQSKYFFTNIPYIFWSSLVLIVFIFVVQKFNFL